MSKADSNIEHAYESLAHAFFPRRGLPDIGHALATGSGLAEAAALAKHHLGNDLSKIQVRQGSRLVYRPIPQT
jgi:hypothetical protein